jgi:hypothetical protein
MASTPSSGVNIKHFARKCEHSTNASCAQDPCDRLPLVDHIRTARRD